MQVSEVISLKSEGATSRNTDQYCSMRLQGFPHATAQGEGPVGVIPACPGLQRSRANGPQYMVTSLNVFQDPPRSVNSLICAAPYTGLLAGTTDEEARYVNIVD